MQSQYRMELLDRVGDGSLRKAFTTLEEGFKCAPLEIFYGSTGHVRAVTFRAGRWYPLAFIPNKRDILFYIRKPALNLERGLHGLAEQHHSGWVNVNQRGHPAPNSAGETKVRIRSNEDAETLVGWLRPRIQSLGSHL